MAMALYKWFQMQFNIKTLKSRLCICQIGFLALHPLNFALYGHFAQTPDGSYDYLSFLTLNGCMHVSANMQARYEIISRCTDASDLADA